ncbi:hypothetical protein PI125_g3291 [Phytophthora idaei]|nr:hypothetical protein PI125_g3291 [Phytophthora idaei]
MRTTFTFDDDKQLVQLARGYIDADTRVSWKDITCRMRPTGHTAVALRQRMQTLYRTCGRDITLFQPISSQWLGDHVVALLP